MKHIFVTGGAGYIGSVCAEQLLDRGYQVTVFDNLSQGHKKAVDSRAKLIIGDLQDRQAILRAMNEAAPDAVMHFAADSLVGESMQNPSKYFRNNNFGTINLLDAMIEQGVYHLVFSSTCATFGLPKHLPLSEDQPQNPINPYGESKLITEKILGWYDKIHHLRTITLRYFNAAGASKKFGEDHRTETHLIPNALKVALGKKPHLELFGTDYDTPDGTCIRDYVHILDLAQAHILALGAEKSAAYNLGTGGGTSVREVIAACEKVTGRHVAIVEKERRPGDPSRLFAASDKLKQELGWKPEFETIDKIVSSAWAWHHTHPDGYGD